jgi:hypothetical protein
MYKILLSCFGCLSYVCVRFMSNEYIALYCSGYVEFWNTEACDKAATLNGKNLLGRPIRIDWTD